MKILEAIARTRNIKPSHYDDATMVAWLSDVDGMIFREFISWHEPAPPPPLPSDNVAPEEDTEGGAIETISPGEEAQQQKPPVPQEVPHGPYDPETDMDTVLMVPDPYSSLYIKYLTAQIDFYNNEIARYNNSMAMFHVALSAFVDAYNRTHMPKQDNYIRI